MRLSNATAAAAAVGAATFCCRVSCFGVQPAPPSFVLQRTTSSIHRRCRATRRPLPCRSGNMNLAAGGDQFEDVANAMSSPLSRARDVLFEPAFRNMLPLMAAAGALLGPNLDNYHSAFGVLTYKNPVEISIANHLVVTTDWWVPPLFAVAGAGIGALYILGDAALETPQAKREPNWRDVFLSISIFSLQYYLSGLLTATGCNYWVLVLVCSVIAERVFDVFDATRVGLLVSLATAVLGPLIEVLLVNATGLYVYNGADFFGVDSWIPVVYFCGGPAVGNLARAVYAKQPLLATAEDRGKGQSPS
ncbi:unnamed protein product [Hapterophycus canaliculatus]